MTLDRYAPGVRLGRGTTGSVWEATDQINGQIVAVKVLNSTYASEAGFFEQFLQEAHALASLYHRHIVGVLEHGMVSELWSHTQAEIGTPFLVMERVYGKRLHLGSDATWTQVLAVARALLSALAHAHARGITHRDIKPGNVLVNADLSLIQLTDFGLAARNGYSTASLTVLPAHMPQAGTPAYMAPEQIRGEWREFGPSTDLYALGGLIWRLVTGAPPLKGESAHTTMANHLYAELPPFRPLMPVPPGLHHLLKTMLRKEPEERPQHARQVLRALEDLHAGWRRHPPARRSTRRWQNIESANSPAPSVRMALSLARRRQLPIVGRYHARQSMWRTLSRVVQSRRSGTLVLRAAVGETPLQRSGVAPTAALSGARYA